MMPVKKKTSLKIGIRRFLIFTILALLGCNWLFHAYAKTRPECAVPLVQTPNVAPYYGKKSCPIVGRIGNVKLKVPPYYAFPLVGYKGVDIWNAQSFKNRPKHPTLDTEIDNFSIRLRLTNFKPIESEKDLQDILKIGSQGYLKQPKDNRWFYAEFRKNNQKYTRKDQLNIWLNSNDPPGGFVRLNNIWGLEHYTSRPRAMWTGSNLVERDEIFYDAENNSTFILCRIVENSMLAIETTWCEIDYSIPDLNVFVNADQINYIDEISRWKEIEENVNKIFRSFVVN